jgi:DNA-binding transcriptional ArsR family regulator
MPGSPADVKLVSNAMANATRRKIMAMLVESNRTIEFIICWIAHGPKRKVDKLLKRGRI